MSQAWQQLEGRGRVRIREVHVRDRYGPLLAKGADGAVKLDLVLRGLSPLPESGRRPGLLPPEISWEALHDLVRDQHFYAGDAHLKRKWVSANLLKLERAGLVLRVGRTSNSNRPEVRVLRDDASGEPLDDPTGDGLNSYLTFLGDLVVCGQLARWGGPELAAYFAAMTAERFAPPDPTLCDAAGQERWPLGGGIWYRPLEWFADPESWRPSHHVRFPFSERTLRRGLAGLRHDGMIDWIKISSDPTTGRPLEGKVRRLVMNGFDDARPGHSTTFPWQIARVIRERRQSFAGSVT